MAWENLKDAVNTVITSNGNNEITGEILQTLLNENIIPQLGNDKYKGIAIPSTAPGVIQNEIHYLAYENGVYSNFGGLVVDNELVILKFKDDVWEKDSIFPFSLIKGNYDGTLEGLKNIIDNANFSLATTYQTAAELPTSPYPAEGTPAKVANDPNEANNGYYSVSGGAWVKDVDLVEDNLTSINTNKGLSANQGRILNENKLEKDGYAGTAQDLKNDIDLKTNKGGYIGSAQDLKDIADQKLPTGGYAGTAQDLKNDIDTISTTGIKTYQTLADLNAVALPTENDAAKVANDPTDANNGYYGYNGSAWVKDANLFNNTIIKDDTVKGVSGKAVFDFTEPTRTGKKRALDAILAGKYIHPNGNLTNITSNDVKRYEVLEGEEILIAGICAGDVAQYAFYSDSALSSLVEVGPDNGDGSTINEVNFIITVPATATHLAITQKRTAGKIHAYDTKNGQSVIEELRDEYTANDSQNKTYQTLDTSFTTLADKYITNTGAIANLVSYNIKRYAVNAGDFIKVKAFNSGNISLFAFYADIDLTTLISIGEVFAGEETFEGIAEVPDGANYVGLSDKYTVQEYYSDLYLQKLADEDLGNTNERVSALEGANDKITAFGDSLTQGAGGGGTTYLTVLASLLGSGFIYNNLGVGGENVQTIGFRNGAIPGVLENNVSLPGTATTVAIGNDAASGILSVWDNSYVKPLLQGGAGINPVVIDGVECTLSYSSNTYYLARNIAGAAKTLYAGTPIYTNAQKTNRYDGIQIIYVGTNGVWSDINDLINQIKKFVSFGKAKKYIILGIHHRTGFSDFAGLEAEMVKEFGNIYFNVRGYMTGNALEDAGITPTAQDLIDISNGIVPDSLRSDTTHFNSDGYTVLGEKIYQLGLDLGYWN